MGVKVLRKLKILGLVWEQPRYLKKLKRYSWFASQAMKTLKTLRHIARKSKCLKFHQNSLDKASQRILMSTYCFSRITYASPIWYTHCSPSNRSTIEQKLRSISKNIYNIQKQGSTQLFQLVTNHIPLRIKALERTIKLYANVKKYFTSDLERLTSQLGEGYWSDIIKNLAPEISDKVTIESMDLMLKEKFSEYDWKSRKRTLHAFFLQALHMNYDKLPNVGNHPYLIKIDEADFPQTFKLITKTYMHMRRNYPCISCYQGYHDPNRVFCPDSHWASRILKKGLLILQHLPKDLIESADINKSEDLRKSFFRLLRYATSHKRRDILHVLEITAILLRRLQSKLHGAFPEIAPPAAMALAEGHLQELGQHIPIYNTNPFKTWNKLVRRSGNSEMI